MKYNLEHILDIQNVNEKDYRNIDAIHYSLLSALDYHPKICINVYDQKETESMRFGSFVDHICFYEGISTYDPNQFFIMDNRSSPTSGLLNIINYIFEQDPTITRANSDLIIQAAYQTGFGKNWKDETILKKYRESECDEYLRQLSQSRDKIVITNEMYREALVIKEALFNNQYVKQYFNRNLNNILLLYQVPLVFDINTIPNKRANGKCLIDILIVNLLKKTITPVDLKTTIGYPINFVKSFIKWKYYLQAAFYTYGLERCLNDSSFVIHPFRFIVSGRKDPLNPMVYKCTKNDLEIGRRGTKGIKGWVRLVSEYMWHKDNDNWDYPFEYLQKGLFEIDAFERRILPDEE